MNFFNILLIFSLIIGFSSIIYYKNFFLSILISLEIILLNLIVFNFIIQISTGNSTLSTLSIFIIALAAVEASVGISIITLISRNFSNNNLSSLNLLKN